MADDTMNDIGNVGMCPNCANTIEVVEDPEKYDGYCSACFKYKFPEDKRAIDIPPTSKEMCVKDAIVATFPGRGFIFDRPIYTVGTCDCPSRRRIDNYVYLSGTILAIEVDEYAHRHYNKKDEENRYHELLTDHGGKMVYIRFNPDPTTEDKSSLADRLPMLLVEIGKQMDRIHREENTDLVEIIYMFYPTNNARNGRGRGRQLINTPGAVDGVGSHVCTFCSSIFANKSGLNLHLKSAKYCLALQGKDDTNSKCEYCQKQFTSRINMDSHQSVCVPKIKQDYEHQILLLKREFAGQRKEYEDCLSEQKQMYQHRLQEQKKQYEEKLKEQNQLIQSIHARHHEALLKLVSEMS